MASRSILVTLLLATAGWPALEGVAQGTSSSRTSSTIETRIWLDRGLDPVFRPGDRARVYYRASHDAYVALFHLDTDGVLRLLFPAAPDVPHRVHGGRDYRVLFGEATDWNVDGTPGVGYFFALASREPFDFAAWEAAPSAGDWALLSQTGAQMRDDPYLVLNAVAGALVAAPEAGRFAIDLTAYHVGQSYSYPRFLCYSCHAVETFAEWNPYQQACSDYRVVIYNDPYFYPASRYQGNRVVYPLPPDPGQPQFAFKDRIPGESGAPLVQARGAGTQGAAAARPTAIPQGGNQLPPGRAAPASSAVSNPVASPDDGTGNRPVLQRRSTEQADPPPR